MDGNIKFEVNKGESRDVCQSDKAEYYSKNINHVNFDFRSAITCPNITNNNKIYFSKKILLESFSNISDYRSPVLTPPMGLQERVMFLVMRPMQTISRIRLSYNNKLQQ